jgi:hypothetical protein
MRLAVTEPKPLQRLTHGSILIVGVKASNFDEELRTHPRVIMWDNQNEHWIGKDLPQNVHAVFMTRFISHVASTKILAEVRKKHMTIFNPEGTGMIAKQVRELLGLPQKSTIEEVQEPAMQPPTPAPAHGRSKLNSLMQFHDPNKIIAENARFMYEKAQEQGIKTTIGSLTNKIRVMRGKTVKRPSVEAAVAPKSLQSNFDTSIEFFDNTVKDMQALRAHYTATVKENEILKARLEKFKKALEGVD